MTDTLGIFAVAAIARQPYSEECQLCNRFFWFSFYKNHTHIPHECIIYDLTLSNIFSPIIMQPANTHTMNKSSLIFLSIQASTSLQEKLFVSPGAIQNFIMRYDMQVSVISWMQFFTLCSTVSLATG